MKTAAASAFAAVEPIARAVMYEGYLLYPYRSSALKNRQRWMFGRLLPRVWCLAHSESEPWRMLCECLLAGDANAEVQIQVRFLQLIEGDEAIERQATVAAGMNQLTAVASVVPFQFDQVEGQLILTATEATAGLFKLTLAIENLTPGAADSTFESALGLAALSTHAILYVTGGTFLSLIDPPSDAQPLAASCQNVGFWPVLVGTTPGAMLLAAPIILYDYPQIARESPGDMFDATEIDEILALRIQTLTDEEKRDMRAAGAVVGAMLQRTEGLSEEQRLQLHAQLRNVPPQHGFQAGDRVRLRPVRCADALDLMLAGQAATVVSIEQDFEDAVHLAVVMDDDPGRDFGMAGLPGHRFFFRPEEVERLS